MALVLMATHPWGTLWDDEGNVRIAQQASFTTRVGATAVTHYADAAGTGSSTGPVTSDSRGRLMRYVEEGSYNQTINGETLPVEATAGETVATIDAAYIPRSKRPVHVKDQVGFNGDGVTSDQTAYATAIGLLPSRGGTLALPEGVQLPGSALNAFIKNGVKIVGEGWSNSNNAAFGNSVWNTNGSLGGTVLRFTNTVAVAVNISNPLLAMNNSTLRDLMIVGPGSGTSVGVQLGENDPHGINGRLVDNVLVANFALCWDLRQCIDATFLDMRARACHTGIALASTTFQNGFMNTEVQFSDTDAITATSSTRNSFHDGLIQNASGTSGIRAISGTDNTFDGFWFESVTATHTVDIESVAAGTRLTNAHFSSTVADLVRVAGDGCRIGPVYSVDASKVITVTSAADGTVLDQAGFGGGTGTLSDAGTRTTRLGFGVERLIGWLADDIQGPITLGQLPASSLVLSTGLIVTEAFNSSGTDNVSIGGTGNDQRYAADTDVSTTGIKALAAGGSVPPSYSAAGDAITATYKNGGTEPTTGKALVWLEYTTSPSAPA